MRKKIRLDFSTRDYTVIGYYNDNLQIFANHVEAKNPLHAFRVEAQNAKKEHGYLVDRTYICVLEGVVKEGEGVNFPGDSGVDSQTVLEQKDVFK